MDVLDRRGCSKFKWNYFGDSFYRSLLWIFDSKLNRYALWANRKFYIQKCQMKYSCWISNIKQISSGALDMNSITPHLSEMLVASNNGIFKIAIYLATRITYRLSIQMKYVDILGSSAYKVNSCKISPLIYQINSHPTPPKLSLLSNDASSPLRSN